MFSIFKRVEALEKIILEHELKIQLLTPKGKKKRRYVKSGKYSKKKNARSI